MQERVESVMEMIQGKMEIAVKYGADVAILLHNMVYWVEKNQANGVNFRDGRYWTYNSMDALCAMYPLWSRDQIKRLLKRCCELGLLYSGEYNKDRRDRTRWYSPSEEVMALYQIRPESIGRNRQMQSADLPVDGTEQGKEQNRQMQVAESPGADGEIAPPLPRRDQEETKEPPKSPKGDKPAKKRRSKSEPKYRPDLFDRFWSKYPTREGERSPRAKAVSAWDKLKPSLELCFEMSKRLDPENWPKSWHRDEGRYIPQASTWLNRIREDGLQPVAAPEAPPAPAQAPLAFHYEIIDGEEVVVYDD